MLLDTSGPASIHGKRQLLGVQHQADLFGAGMRLLVRDTEGNVDVTRAHAEALLHKDNVDALIGTSLQPTAIPVMDLAQAAGVPMVVPAVVPPPKQSFVFSSGPSSAQMLREFIRSMAAASVHSVGLLIMESLATPDRLAIYRQEAAARGIELAIIETFATPATDLIAPSRAVTAEQPDAIAVNAIPPFNSIAARDLRATGWPRPRPLFFTTAAGHPGFLQAAEAAVEGARLVAPWLLLGERAPDTRPNSWAIHDFVATFTPKHGPVGTYVGFGADAVAMVHNAYAGHRDHKRAREVLEHMTYVGLTGVFHPTATNRTGLDDEALTTVVVRDGTWSTDPAGNDRSRLHA